MTNKLTLKYLKKEACLGCDYPKSASDASFLLGFFESVVDLYPEMRDDFPFDMSREERYVKLTDELERRGYDLKTLKFSIELRKE